MARNENSRETNSSVFVFCPLLDQKRTFQPVIHFIISLKISPNCFQRLQQQRKWYHFKNLKQEKEIFLVHFLFFFFNFTSFQTRRNKDDSRMYHISIQEDPLDKFNWNSCLAIILVQSDTNFRFRSLLACCELAS